MTVSNAHAPTGEQIRAMSRRAQVLADVDDERDRQDAKWGEQNHPDGTGPDTYPLGEIGCRKDHAELQDTLADELAAVATEATNVAAKHGYCTWKDILLEEVFEALAEDDPAKLRTELVQVAAVATQWAEAIARRASTTTPKEA